MRFFPIVWRNLLRRKFRTFFTVGAIFFAFLLFGVLMAIRAAFAMGVDMAGQGRLMVIDKVSIINPLPASYEAQIRQIDGVTDTTHANWFGGYYQDVRNQFATFAVDPESWLRIYSKEYDLPEEQKKAFFADRTGAIIGSDTAKKVRVHGRAADSGPGHDLPPARWRSVGVHDRRDLRFENQGLGQDPAGFQLSVPAGNDPRAKRLPRSLQLVRLHDREPGSRAGDRREDRRVVRQLSVGDEDEHREGLRLRLGEAGRRHRLDHDVDRCDGDVHDPARRRQYDGAGHTRAHQRAGRAEDARIRRRPHPPDGVARIDPHRSGWRRTGSCDLRTRSSP